MLINIDTVSVECKNKKIYIYIRNYEEKELYNHLIKQTRIIRNKLSRCIIVIIWVDRSILRIILDAYLSRSKILYINNFLHCVGLIIIFSA